MGTAELILFRGNVPDAAAWKEEVAAWGWVACTQLCTDSRKRCEVDVAVVAGCDDAEGLRDVSEVCEAYPYVCVLGVARHWDHASMIRASLAGVEVFLTETTNAVVFGMEIEKALTSARARRLEAEAFGNASERWRSLTASEYLVLRGAFNGSTKGRIAAEADVSMRTVDRVRRRAFEKMGAKCLLDIFEVAVGARLSTLPERYEELMAMLSVAGHRGRRDAQPQSKRIGDILASSFPTRS
jgi:FixJ family two-component response regulator